MSMPSQFTWYLLLVLASVTGAGCGAVSADPSAAGAGADAAVGDAVTGPALVPVATNPVPTRAATAYDLHFLVVDAQGQPASGMAVTASVPWGCGKLKAGQVVADANGDVLVQWTTGELPIQQKLQLQANNGATLTLLGDITRTAPLKPVAFAQVDAYLTAHNWTASTEDVAIAPSTEWAVMGVADHLLQVSPAGDVTEWALTGDIGKPLGMMFDANGLLWVADSRSHSLKSVDLAGHVTSVLDAVDGEALVGPNDLFVDSQGRVWLTDPCASLLLRYDPQTKTAQKLASFDPQTQGGPNGIAVSPDGQHVYVTTENPGVLCGKPVAIDVKLGSLWHAPAVEGALTFAPVAQGVGLFGDGCIFDEWGNLYATFDLFDTADIIHLQSSQVLVVPHHTQQPRLVAETQDALFANVVFGRGKFAPGQLLVALLSVPPFTPETARGLMRVDLGQ